MRWFPGEAGKRLKVQLKIAGSSGVVRVWLNGKLVSGLSRTDDLGANAIGQILLGDPRKGLTYDVAFDNFHIYLLTRSTASLLTPFELVSVKEPDVSDFLPTPIAALAFASGEFGANAPQLIVDLGTGSRPSPTPTAMSVAGGSLILLPDADLYVNVGSPALNLRDLHCSARRWLA